ncbi:MAG TPA: response regulator, partial [Gemmatimonadaceae bacterium]|nr:response regulator [Gemmatimonadaceae bacterium]
VESTVGVGSVFRIFLPSLPPDVAVSPHPAASDADASSVPRGSGRVLLAEDDAAVRHGVRRMLDAAGYDVVEVADGAKAKATLDAAGGSFALLLSDIAMPSVDGRQLAHQVRARWPALPIVLMSGFADPDTLACDVPGVTLLQKPLEAATLVNAVQAARRDL